MKPNIKVSVTLSYEEYTALLLSLHHEKTRLSEDSNFARAEIVAETIKKTVANSHTIITVESLMGKKV